MPVDGADEVVVANSVKSLVSGASCGDVANRVGFAASVVGFFWYLKDVMLIGDEVECCNTR